MSGLLDSLSSAAGALTAHRMGLDVAGQNLANINTAGYTRRMLVLGEVPPTDAVSAGRGVTVVELRAIRDVLVDARVRREQGAEALDNALSGLASGVEAIVGLPGESLDADLAAFFNAFSALADNPTSTVARDVVVRAGAGLATAFATMSGQLSTLQRDADPEIRSGVAEVNRLTAELAQLNVDLAVSSYDADSIRDRQGLLLGQLAELADVAVLAREDGGVDVTLRSGQALLIGDTSYALAVPSTGAPTISLEGVDVTSSVAGGRLGGLLRARGTVVPGYLATLDTLAYDLATAVNAVHVTGFDGTGAAAGNFFAAPGGVAGAAANLAVDAALLADSRLVAASGTGAAGDNTIARELANLRDAAIADGGTRSVFDVWGQFVYAAATDAADARASADSHHQVLTQLKSLQAQASGVSYDEEAAHLMRYQRAYEASARYFQTIQSALDSLMEMVR